MITRTYFIDKDRVFVCVIDFDGHSGSIQFNFATGEMIANKPDMMTGKLWNKFLRHFLGICKLMVAPLVALDDD